MISWNGTTGDLSLTSSNDEMFIPELGSGEDHAMPGLGSLQCLTKMDSLDEESSSAKPLKPLNLGSVPDLGIGRLGSLGTPPPNRLGKYFDTVEFIYYEKTLNNNFKNIWNYWNVRINKLLFSRKKRLYDQVEYFKINVT